jgi:hypothetical protein
LYLYIHVDISSVRTVLLFHLSRIPHYVHKHVTPKSGFESRSNMNWNTAERYTEYNTWQESESRISLCLACDTYAGISSDLAKYSATNSLTDTCTCSHKTVPSTCYERRVQLDFCTTNAYRLIKIKTFFIQYHRKAR